jgi:transcriptional regulator with XRE-family HTH domain
LDYSILGYYPDSVAFANAMEKSIHSAQYALFLQVLRTTRERAGLTQVQLARKIGETQTFVSKCERGERRIDVVELRTFCQAFGLTLKDFVAVLERAIRKGG